MIKSYISNTYWSGKSKSSVFFFFNFYKILFGPNWQLLGSRSQMIPKFIQLWNLTSCFFSYLFPSPHPHLTFSLSTFLFIISELKYILWLKFLHAVSIDFTLHWEDNLLNTNAREIQCPSTIVSEFSQNIQIPFIRCETNILLSLLPVILWLVPHLFWLCSPWQNNVRKKVNLFCVGHSIVEVNTHTHSFIPPLSQEIL